MNEHGSVLARPPRWVAALATVCIAAGCGSGPTAQGAGERKVASGVTGVTVVDIGCPTLTTTTRCPTQPIPAQLKFTRLGSTATIMEVRTREDGRFTVELPPGRYQVLPTNLTSGPLPSAEPLTVEVIKDRFTQITVQFDSGVR